MNLKGKYDMLRAAILVMAGVPDDVKTLKEMSAVLQIPALHDADVAATRLVLQTLIVTHADTPADQQHDPRLQATIDLIDAARKVWMAENPCEEGRDHVTPFDHLLYGVRSHD